MQLYNIIHYNDAYAIYILCTQYIRVVINYRQQANLPKYPFFTQLAYNALYLDITCIHTHITSFNQLRSKHIHVRALKARNHDTS